MPARLASPVISVDINKMSKVDPSNADNLFSMWAIFSKCAESLENGRRLENLSWRLWNRETFCCDDEETHRISALRAQRYDSEISPDIPRLSTSVESISDSEIKLRSTAIQIQALYDCSERYRGKEKHMTPDNLVKIMADIDKTSEWKSREEDSPLSKLAQAHSEKSKAQPIPSKASVSTEGSYSHPSAQSVIRGFDPGRVSSSYRSTPSMTLTNLSPVVVSPIKRKTKIFQLGASSSDSEDDEEDVGMNKRKRRQLKESCNFKTDKRTSFQHDVATRTIYDGEGGTTEDEEVISESAIEEDDGSEWESSSESAISYEDNNLFKRKDSKPQLVSRRSLLSTMLHEPQRAAALANAASKSTPAIRHRAHSPRGPPSITSPSQKGEVRLDGPGITRSKPIIMTTTNTHHPALSPRTTRRNMLATELTESLRKHLLWERQQKNTITASHLKRRHTAHDMTKLTEYPQPRKGHASKNNSWNNAFAQGHNDYNEAGW